MGTISLLSAILFYNSNGYFKLIFQLGFTPCTAEQPLRGMELQEQDKDEELLRKLIRESPQIYVPINSRQFKYRSKKGFCRQRILESDCARKETVDIDVLITSRYGDKKNHILPFQINIYQSNIYRKDLSWLHFDDEPRVQ